MANGYVRGALEYAAGAWMPASSPSHLDLVDRELRAAARVVTGCPVSTPVHALMTEAGMPTARVRREVLSARMLGLASSLPEGDPLRALAEPALTEPSWHDVTGVSFALEVGPDGRRDRPPPDTRRKAAEDRLATLPAEATWVWSDGSASGGVLDGGGGAKIVFSDGDTREVRVAAGSLCSSTRAELFALRAALEELLSGVDHAASHPIVVCTDSSAALALLRSGPAAQRTPVAADLWALLRPLADREQPIVRQWVPAHCGLPGNERADALAREASALSTSDPRRRPHHPAGRRALRHLLLAAELAGRLVPFNLAGPAPGPGRGDRPERRGGHPPAPSRPLERFGAVPAQDRPSTLAWL